MSSVLALPRKRTRLTKTFILGAEHNGVVMPPEEFDRIERWDEFYRYELIRGVVIVSPIASLTQVEPVDELGYLLRLYREQHPQGSALDATHPERYIRVGNSRRRADRVIWAGLGRAPNEEQDVPTVAVEWVSSGKANYIRDYEEKRDEYEEAGVEEYWLIDPFRRIMTVFRAGRKEIVVKEGETYQTPLLPGFMLPLSRLLSCSDRYSKTKKRRK